MQIRVTHLHKILDTLVLYPVIDGSYVNNGSYFARMDGIRYFMGTIKDSPIFGLGNFNTSSGTTYWNMIHGPLGFYYTQDIGLIGDIARLGFPIFIMYVFMLIKSFKVDQKRKENSGLKILLLSFMGSISFLSNGLILALIFVLLEDSDYEKND